MRLEETVIYRVVQVNINPWTLTDQPTEANTAYLRSVIGIKLAMASHHIGGIRLLNQGGTSDNVYEVQVDREAYQGGNALSLTPEDVIPSPNIVAYPPVAEIIPAEPAGVYSNYVVPMSSMHASGGFPASGYGVSYRNRAMISPVSIPEPVKTSTVTLVIKNKRAIEI